MTRPRRARALRGELSDVEWAFLLDRPMPEGADLAEWWSLDFDNPVFRTDRPSVRELWDLYAADVLAEWTASHPGTRPSLWWRYSAPRMAQEDVPPSWHGTTPPEALRRRLGGIGTPAHEWTATAPRFANGIPSDWLWRGGLLRGDAAELADPNDPPLYESQAAYLERNGLFLPVERERLSADDFAPEHVRP